MSARQFFSFLSKKIASYRPAKNLLVLSAVLLVSLLLFGSSSATASSIQAAICPSGIGFGETIQCSINSSGEQDSYTFTASAGDKVLVRMSTSAGSLWSGIQVYGPGGIKLCEAGSPATAEIASCTLAGGGTYSILAYDGFNGTGTGDYYLYLQRLNNPGTPVSIAFGQTLPGSILSPAQMNTYTFTANAGDKVLLTMSTSAGSLWPGIRLYDPNGIKLCEHGNIIATCTLTGGGTYTVLLFDNFNGTNTGDYFLYLQRLNNPGAPVSISFGQTRLGSILSPAQMNTYTFTASAGDKVLVRMSTSTGSLWSGIQVYGPGGIKLCEAGSPATAEIASCTLADGGTYSILAYDDFNATGTGDYYLYLQRLNNPGTPVSIAFGQTLPGSILSPAQMNTYTFTANAGDKVLLTMSTSAGSLWPGIRLYDPNGIKLCEHGNIIATCTLTGGGTYTVLLFDNFNGTNTGDYFLYLQRLNNPGAPVSISFGQTRLGSILSPAQMNTYTFTASAGDKVLVRMSTSTGSLWSGIQVYGPGGIKLCEAGSPATAEIASCTLADGGTYSILAYDDFNATGTGDYYLYLQRLNNPGTPVSIAFGQTLPGSILSPAQMNTYTFTANAGDKVLLTMSTSAGSLWPGIRLYDPNGIKLCEHGNIIATCTLTSTGTYTVLLFDNFNGTNTGDYFLYLQRLNNPGAPVSISFGQTRLGSILSPAQMNTYTFTASAGDKVLVRMSTSTGSLWSGIQVYSPGGIKLCEAGSPATAEIASCTLADGGTYSILAYDDFNATGIGDYTLYLQRLNTSGIPTPISPTGTISNIKPSYTWSKVPGATQYQFQTLRATTVVYTISVPASTCGTTANCVNTPSPALGNFTYTWKVRAMVGGAWKAFSAVKTFTIRTVPTPISPTGTITTTKPTYTWSKVPGATQYQFQTLKGSTTVVYTITIPASTCGTTANCVNTPSPALGNFTYTWKVRAMVGGAWKAFSAVKTFTIRTVPTPISPTGTITTTKPTYTWTKVPGATQYQFQTLRATTVVYTISVPASTCGTTANCVKTPSPALGNFTYTWKVRAMIGGVWTAYSPVKTFTVTHP